MPHEQRREHRRRRPRVDRLARRRRLRPAALAHDERLLRRLARGQPGAQRLRDQWRVPLCCIVPRRRRPHPRPRRGHAVAADRLDRGLPVAARLRGGPAAALGGLHLAGLRAAAPGVRRRAPGLEPARGRDRPALPHPAVPGRRPDPPHAHRGAVLGGPARRRRRRLPQRASGRDAQRHARAGLPLLAQAARPAHATLLPARRPRLARRRPRRRGRARDRLGRAARR